MSVMEISHRTPTFIDIAERAESSLRTLLDINDDYHVLFLQGGATLQFAMVPMNLSKHGDMLEYVHTGHWSKRALIEASRLRDVHVIGTPGDSIDPESTWSRHSRSKYLHITTNETISGLQWKQFPSDNDLPLVADASSDILSRSMDINQFSLLYACAQKNFGPSGLTVVIVRKDLCRDPLDNEPYILNYNYHASQCSMYNTPNTFAWYVSGLVFDWIIEQGGLSVMNTLSENKSTMLYQMIDQSDFYRNQIEPEFRSSVNVVFNLSSPKLEKQFLTLAKEAGFLNLKGHRSVGGIRASLYIGVSIAAVKVLVEFMKDFEQKFG